MNRFYTMLMLLLFTLSFFTTEVCYGRNETEAERRERERKAALLFPSDPGILPKMLEEETSRSDRMTALLEAQKTSARLDVWEQLLRVRRRELGEKLRDLVREATFVRTSRLAAGEVRREIEELQGQLLMAEDLFPSSSESSEREKSFSMLETAFRRIEEKMNVLSLDLQTIKSGPPGVMDWTVYSCLAIAGFGALVLIGKMLGEMLADARRKDLKEAAEVPREA